MKLLLRILSEIKDLLKEGSIYNKISNVRYTHQPITKNQKIKSECNSISFLNKGNTTVLIEGMPLGPDDGMRTYGNEINLKDVTDWRIVFLKDAPVGETANNNLFVIKRVLEGENNYFKLRH